MKRFLTISLICLLLATAISGCGKEKPAEIDLNALHEKVQGAFGEENQIQMQQLTKEECQERYGLTEEMYTEIIAEVPMINVQIDEFVAVRAADNKVKDVENALTNFQTAYKQDMSQYPSNQVKIQASKVLVKGDYVFFLMLGPISMETEGQGEEAILKEAEANNQKVSDIIDSFFQK